MRGRKKLRTVLRGLSARTPSDRDLFVHCAACEQRICSDELVFGALIWDQADHRVRIGFMCAHHVDDGRYHPIVIKSVAGGSIAPYEYTAQQVVCMHNKRFPSEDSHRIRLSGRLWVAGSGIRVGANTPLHVAAHFDDDARFRGVGLFPAEVCRANRLGTYKLLELRESNGQLQILIPRPRKAKKQGGVPVATT